MSSRALAVSVLAVCFIFAPFAASGSQLRNLEEAQRDLEQWLGAAGVQRVKQARSEQEMYGVIGLIEAISLTNRWHLWENPPLARYFKSIGVTEPHDMVGIVSATYWCKLHGKPFRLRERAARLQRIYREEAANERSG